MAAATPDWHPIFVLRWQSDEPVLSHAKVDGVEFGFEGGKAFRIPETGSYFLATAELFKQPVNANLRTAVWEAPSLLGPWKRQSIIATSNQSFPMVYFDQQCNQPWCRWQNSTRELMSYVASFQCDPNVLLASPWAPQPVYDEVDEHWHVLFVGYQCDFRQLVTAGTGNIFGARSTKPGREGLGGPYELYGTVHTHDVKGGKTTFVDPKSSIVLGPDADPARGGTRWGDKNRTDRYVDQMGIYSLGPDKGYAAFVGVGHYLARAERPTGPWTIQETSLAPFMKTTASPYNENVIVTPLTDPDGHQGFVACFDTVFRESVGFGVQYSKNGLDWGQLQQGEAVVVPRGMRTPLGLLEEPDGGVSLLFTRRYPDCENRTRVQLDNSGGFGSSSPGMCADVYAARFDVVWHNAKTGENVRRNARIPSAGAATGTRNLRSKLAATLFALVLATASVLLSCGRSF